MYTDILPILDAIKSAQKIILTTHKQCDGDGLGAMIGLYHAIIGMGKEARVFSVDQIDSKYKFLKYSSYMETYLGEHNEITPVDLVLIFDTNDKRIVDPLYSELEGKAKKIIFIDHHPILKEGPQPTDNSYIECSAASTGEITYKIIKALGVEITKAIAEPLYTSIAFDTQVFRFVRNSRMSHLIASELLLHDIAPDEIHKEMFANQTLGKLGLLKVAFTNVQVFGDKSEFAFLRLEAKHLEEFNLTIDDTRDILDLIMNIASIEIGAIILSNNEGGHKLSLRSRGKYNVTDIAEDLGGGGHSSAAGAYLKGDFKAFFELIKDKVLQKIKAA